MVSPHPFHKRVLSRVGFYGGAVCYLWLLQIVEQKMSQTSLTSQTTSAFTVTGEE